MLWVGGLRGAIAYTMAISYEGPFRLISLFHSGRLSLSTKKDDSSITHRDEFIDTTIVIIFSTVILNGVVAGKYIVSIIVILSQALLFSGSV